MTPFFPGSGNGFVGHSIKIQRLSPLQLGQLSGIYTGHQEEEKFVERKHNLVDLARVLLHYLHER